MNGRRRPATVIFSFFLIFLTVSYNSCREDFFVKASSPFNNENHLSSSRVRRKQRWLMSPLLSNHDCEVINHKISATQLPKYQLAFTPGHKALRPSHHAVGSDIKKCTTGTTTAGNVFCSIKIPKKPFRCCGSSSRRMLFNMPDKPSGTVDSTNTYSSSMVKGRGKILKDVLDDLASGTVQFPYEIKTSLSDPIRVSAASLIKQQPQNAQTQVDEPTKIALRHLEEEDLNSVVQMCVTEFGSFSSSNEQQQIPGMALEPLSSTTKSPLDPFFDSMENWMFSRVVRIGLSQRIQRRRQGYNSSSSSTIIPDHNVICLVERIKDNNGLEKDGNIIGIAEVSLQPPNPQRTAPPFVLPVWIKRILSKASNVPQPSPYVSNVLVKEEYRGKGYSKLLMVACEGFARKWGFHEVSLHVDADLVSGRVAQGLYDGLGYKGVADEKANTKYGWMGPEILNQGLYIVEGVPLLYLRKILSRYKNRET